VGTTFDEIIDLAKISFNDYKLDQLYNISIDDFTTYMSGFVVKSIPKFYDCKQNLESVNLMTNTFPFELTLTEKVILSDFTVIEWMTSKILDITQMNLHLNDTDFRHYSEAQNLTAKTNVQNILIERVNQNATSYGIKNIPWSDWANGNFGI